MDTKYLTIKELSKIVGTSPQSIYQRLETTLKEYVKVVKGRKYLDIRVLKEVYNIDLEQDFKQDFKGIKQGFKADNQDDTIKLLQDTLDTLKSQLEQKDKQIEELTKSLQFEQGKSKDLQDKLFLLEDKQKEEPIEQPIKKSWWSKIFQ